jgi:hypothetical protein
MLLFITDELRVYVYELWTALASNDNLAVLLRRGRRITTTTSYGGGREYTEKRKSTAAEMMTGDE